jgi:DNA helicase-2/ATP-dependent DNA helicase PcrA
MSFLVEAEGSSALAEGPAPRRRSGSPQQEAFWRELAGGSSHVLLEARAGAGKSTSCAEGMHRLPRGLKVTYCAFNKAIAAEFQARAPAGCVAATMHSLGYAAVRAAYGDVVINDYKTADLAEKYFPRRHEDKESRYAAAKLVSACKAGLAWGADPDALADLAGAAGVDLGDAGEDVLAVVPELLRESKELTSVIDFDDMIWLPVVNGLTPRPCDVLFVDEAQDLNPAQQAMAGRLCPDGRVVVVGDPRQSIYAFRGADAESITNMADQLAYSARGLARYPLTVTWRCPASHVRLANAIVPDLESAPGAAEGSVEGLSPEDALKALAPGAMALCRTNAPLVSACYRLLRAGVPAVIRGRDVGRGLLTLVARLRARSVPDLVGRLDDYHAAETGKLCKLRHPEPALIALEDKVACLLAMTEGQTSVDGLKARIESLFTDVSERGAVLLSSVHRAKGLERPSVTVLAPEQLPHPMARTPAERGQEANLAYVAATRSKDRLVFAGPVPPIFS